jgi:hypothetical protein
MRALLSALFSAWRQHKRAGGLNQSLRDFCANMIAAASASRARNQMDSKSKLGGRTGRNTRCIAELCADSSVEPIRNRAPIGTHYEKARSRPILDCDARNSTILTLSSHVNSVLAGEFDEC